jgi:hypothetical protein
VRQTDAELAQHVLDLVQQTWADPSRRSELREEGVSLMGQAMRERPNFLDVLAREAVAAGLVANVDDLVGAFTVH